MNWIEINLPWFKYIEATPVTYPIESINQQVREKFGKTIQELDNEFYKEFGKSPYTVEIDFIHHDWIKYKDLTKDELLNIMKGSIDPIVVKLVLFLEKQNEINNWASALPEVELFKLKLKTTNEQTAELRAKSCFSNCDLNRPGVMIEVQDKGGKIQRHLIGDINESAGTCDDCQAFNHDDIVLRALELISEKELEDLKYNQE
jgi:hypothetical protein